MSTSRDAPKVSKALLNEVLEAQNFDKNGQYQEAFGKYVHCLQSLANQLIIEKHGLNFHVSETIIQYVSLCVMCSERLKDIMENINTHDANGNSSKAIKRSSSFISPVDVAHQQNSQLFFVRQEAIKTYAAPDKDRSLTLNLSLQRKMAENMIIAVKHQQAMERKKEERKKRILEEVERKFKSQNSIHKDEIARREIFHQVLQYEANSTGFSNLRGSQDQCFSSSSFIQDLVAKVLSTNDHPLTGFLKREQFGVCFKTKESLDKMNEEPKGERDSKFIETIKDEVVSDAKRSFENVCTMFVVAYDKLDNSTGRATLTSSLEPHFYHPPWSFLVESFGRAMVDNENKLNLVMEACSKMDFSPFHMGVQKRLLLDLDEDPYRLAIDSLRSVPRQPPIAAKLKFLSEAFQHICQSVKDYSVSHSLPMPEIGADELLPILSYCLIKTNLSSLYSEFHLLMDLTDENLLLGESGYCLASVLMALDWIAKLEIKDLVSNDRTGPDNLKI